MSNSSSPIQRGHGILIGTILAMTPFGMAPDKANGAGSVLWCEGIIQRASTEGDCRQLVIEFESQGIGDLDVDPETKKVYFTRMFSIHRCDLDGGNAEVIHTDISDQMSGIDIDAVNRKVYWATYSPAPAGNRIMRADMDGSNVELLLSGFGVPFGIATDPIGGRVYWTQGLFGPNASGAIHRANLDGSSHEQIATLAGQVPYGIAIHCASSKVYWTDGMSGDVGVFGGIYRANLDGSNVEPIVIGLQGLRQLDIDEVNGKLYLAKTTTPANVFRCDLDGSNLVALGLGDSHGIAFVPEGLGLECYGDLNHDSFVNVQDLLSVISAWGPCRSCETDFNGDGIVNVQDLLCVVNHWTT